jgi:glycosyltransferase involved in cell wall biosynthesis
MSLAPVVLFTYNRIETLKKTVEFLQKCDLSSETELFIFSDAAKNDNDILEVKKVRDFISSIRGFKNLHIVKSANNKGLANSIINGVSEIINQFGKVIVLEDDLLVSSNFLNYMNRALDFYEHQQNVFSVSGFIFDMKIPDDYAYDVFFTKRNCSWGWAMWKDRWNEIDWKIKDFESFINSQEQRKAFNRIGTDLTDSLIRQQKGEINSWAIRCNYHQFKKDTYTVYPAKSKVNNIGFDKNATHTKQRFNRYFTTLENPVKNQFSFPSGVKENKILLRRFSRKYSRFTRIYYFVLNKASKLIYGR